MKEGIGITVVLVGLYALCYVWANKSVWDSQQSRMENTSSQIAIIQTSLGTNWETVNDSMAAKYGYGWTNDLTPSMIDEVYEYRKQLRKN